jgi:class 3 adenylate cyclase
VVRRYQRAVADVVRRLAGNVAHYLGDGIVAYFGYPEASEDDAERAIRAGLDMLAAIRTLNRELAREAGAAQPVRLAVRIGIHTSPVGGPDGRGRAHRGDGGETPNWRA